MGCWVENLKLYKIKFACLGSSEQRVLHADSKVRFEIVPTVKFKIYRMLDLEDVLVCTLIAME